jgi:trehalose 6-phosphate phosphatase
MSVPGLQDEAPPLISAADALYLDFDGTLADLAPRPDRVEIRRELPALLLALHARLDGAVAIVTGRRLATVDDLLAPVVLPGAGLHGAELRKEAGGHARLQRPPGMGELVEALRARFGSIDGLFIEDKEAAVALHYRLAPERADECTAAMRSLATNLALEVIRGHCVVEARPRGVNKGRALRTLAQYRPLAGRRPVFIGDDVTDEDGFRVAAELGGYGVKVGDGVSEARYRCRGVNEVHDWLRSSLHALEREG